MSDDKFDVWPFFRDEPDKVVLPPLAGVEASSKPPVRIFLGTEESQYRAERIFFYSILQVRDPARTYEIYLMKNLAGFDRRGWRTGFTNYRYAIPTMAGGSGKAIYNDVDQIYLADPALLFDLPLEDHGYLAIADTDTSVMLIDCAKMLPMWNREAASTGKKGDLLNRPRKVGGLWGQLDGHWNARDQEYDERLTKCLHYTALHQQPWEPFPEVYSYHANPLAYVWHDLERRADAEGYQAFTQEAPSPDYARRVNANSLALPSLAQAPVPNDKAVVLSAKLACRSMEEVGVAGEGQAEKVAAFGLVNDGRLTLQQGPANWPAGRSDLVTVFDLFEAVPPADVPWLLDLLFQRAQKLLYIAIRVNAGEGIGSKIWWERRIAQAAQAHPDKSWHFDAIEPGMAVRAVGFERRRNAMPERVWVLTTDRPLEDRQAVLVASQLGAPFETKALAFGPLAALPNAARGSSCLGLDSTKSAKLERPWPDLVIASEKAAPVARWIKAQNNGKTRLVQIGGPGSAFEDFDLIVARPEEQLPIRDNVLQVAAPLVELPKSEQAVPPAQSTGVVAVLVSGGLYPYSMPEEVALEIARKASLQAGAEGTVLLCALSSSAEAVSGKMAAAISGKTRQVTLPAGSGRAERLAEILREADRVIVTSDDREVLRVVAAAGTPIAFADLPHWYDKLKVVRPVLELLKKATGGGVTYRGTPHQQHVVGRFLDRLTVAGWRKPAFEPVAVRRALIARGLASPLGGEFVSTVKHPDDLQHVVARVKRLLAEQPTTA